MRAIILDAINHVRRNKTWNEVDEFVALERINETRCTIVQASERITNEIRELMGEYLSDRGYDSNLWEEETSEDEIFWEL